MTEKEIYDKILQINKNFDFVASCIKFYKQEFENLEDELAYCGKYSWLPDHKEKVKEIMDFLDIEGELIDLLDKPDGLKQLGTIEHMLKKYETYKPTKTFK